MARFTFKLPDIGEGISEAEIVAWHVRIGDRVEEDQQIADMMTDKATVEMESPVAGTIVALAGEVGDQVAIGAALVVIETDGAEAEVLAIAESEIAEEFEMEDTPPPVPHRAAVVVPSLPEPSPAPSPAPVHERVASREPHRAILASPAVRARALDLGIDLAQVKSAEGDRIRHADLDAYLRYQSGQGYLAPNAGQARADEVIKVIGMRRRIAENMQAAKRNIPHFTYVDEIDVTALEEMRADLNNNRGTSATDGRPKLTMLPLLIVALCKTLPDFPMLNARYDDEAGVVTRSGAVHLGMATQTDAGLMVPVIRDAQARNVWQLATEIARLAEAARTGRAKSEELSGSTITITSLGALGGIATTPVINRPEVAIIGPNKIVERPIFRPNGRGGDEIVRAKCMNLSISCDHRVVDGWDAASFVQALKKYLETPVLLFAQ